MCDLKYTVQMIYLLQNKTFQLVDVESYILHLNILLYMSIEEGTLFHS